MAVNRGSRVLDAGWDSRGGCDIIVEEMGGKARSGIRKVLKSFKAVQTWQLVLVLIPLIFFTATLLRFNHLKMVELRAAVLEADAAGDEAEIERSLTELRDFVFTHIVVNTAESNGVQSIIFGTGPFYLEQQYLRAANAAIEAAQSSMVDDTNPNGNIYAAVSAICQPQAIANGWAWYSQPHLDCWTSELAKYPASDNLGVELTADIPSTELYRRNYASPIWAPTAAGFAMLICVILAFIIVVRILIWCVLNLALLLMRK